MRVLTSRMGTRVERDSRRSEGEGNQMDIVRRTAQLGLQIWSNPFHGLQRPPTKREQELIDELRSAFDLAPQVSADGESEAANRWAQFQKRLRSLVLSRDPREFLSWDVISKTMFLAFSPYAVRELIHLKRQNNWNSRWKEALLSTPSMRRRGCFRNNSTISWNSAAGMDPCAGCCSISGLTAGTSSTTSSHFRICSLTISNPWGFLFSSKMKPPARSIGAESPYGTSAAATTIFSEPGEYHQARRRLATLKASATP